MRRLWDQAKRFSRAPRHHRLVLSDESRKDIRWWQYLLSVWNGKAFFLFQHETPATELGLYTDASGAIGWGAYYAKEGRWLQERWTDDHMQQSIEFKELYAILAACATWGHRWPRLRVAFHCDNQSVVACLTSGTSRAPPVMSLLRKLFIICATNNFHIVAYHVPGKANAIADSLSRFNLQAFRRHAPTARSQPDVPVPPPTWD